MKKPLLLVLGAALLGAWALQWMPKREQQPGRGPHLRAVLPRELTGWIAKEVPLGPTEAATGAVEKTLRFDDVYFREFTSGDRTISLYVAYWGPGKMPTQLVASHTPDRCWVENGWSCDAVRHDVSLLDRDSSLLPGEWRIFSAPTGKKLTVLFWHRVGDALYDYGGRVNRVPSVWRWWRDAAAQILRSPNEQYFVRLTSDRPFETLAGDAGWLQLTSALGQLGLSQPKVVRRS